MTSHSASSSAPFKKEHLDDALLERYWLGETSAEESAVVAAWFARHPEWQARYEQLRRGLTANAADDLSSGDMDRLIAGALDAMGIGHAGEMSQASVPHVVLLTEREPRSIPEQSRTWPLVLKRMNLIGPMVAVVLAIGLTWIFGRDHASMAEQTYTTGIGQRITVTLPDSSRVTLAPQTTLHVTRGFGSSLRTVSLTGEAHFDIASVSPTPFIIQTGTVQTRVLGTRFIVRRYREDRDVRVAVETGKVAVGHVHETPVVLTAGRIAAVGDSGIVLFDSTHLSTYTGWMHDQLSFQDTPLSEMLAVLSRWYGVEFRVADPSVATSVVTGVFPNESLEDVLNILKNLLSVSLSYTRNDTGGLVVTLSPIRNDVSPRFRRNDDVSIPTAIGR